MKKLFGGELTVMSDTSPEKKAAVIKLLEGIGYSQYGNVREALLANGYMVGVNGDLGKDKYWQASSTGGRNVVTFEKFVLEILGPEKEADVWVTLSNGREALVYSDGRVKVGCYEVTVSDAEAIIKAYEGLQ
jgi:hypothetical protein